MRRIGAALVPLTILLMFVIGCEEDAVSVNDTGFQVRFASLELREIELVIDNQVVVDTIPIEQPALTFAVWVFVDDEYQGRASTDESKFFPFPSGTYYMYVRSNMRKVTEDTFYTWTRNFTVNDGAISFMTFYTDTIFRGL